MFTCERGLRNLRDKKSSIEIHRAHPHPNATLDGPRLCECRICFQVFSSTGSLLQHLALSHGRGTGLVGEESFPGLLHNGEKTLTSQPLMSNSSNEFGISDLDCSSAVQPPMRSSRFLPPFHNNHLAIALQSRASTSNPRVQLHQARVAMPNRKMLPPKDSLEDNLGIGGTQSILSPQTRPSLKRKHSSSPLNATWEVNSISNAIPAPTLALQNQKRHKGENVSSPSDTRVSFQPTPWLQAGTSHLTKNTAASSNATVSSLKQTKSLGVIAKSPYHFVTRPFINRLNHPMPIDLTESDNDDDGSNEMGLNLSL